MKVKYVPRNQYAIVDQYGILSTTDTRESARNIKRALGGAEKGVRIVQFQTKQIVR